MASLFAMMQGSDPNSAPGAGLPNLTTARGTEPVEPTVPAPIASNQSCPDCSPCPTCGPGTLNHAPVISPGGPYYGTAGTPISFTGLHSFDVDPGDGINDYAWSFGDNTAIVNGAMPAHTYQASGNYTVSLTVTDQHSATSSTGTTATISAAPAASPAPSPTQGNGATFVSQTVPSMMEGRGIYEVSVTMRNTGSTTWSAAHLYRLGFHNPDNPLDDGPWGKNRVALEQTVPPGEFGIFLFSVVAPTAVIDDESEGCSTPYDFRWKMVQDGVQWFGEPGQSQVVSVPCAPEASGHGSVSVDGLANIGSARWEPRNRTGQAGEDLLSGNFNGRLSLLSLAGRSGLDLGLTLSWNSLVWTRVNPLPFNRFRPPPYMAFDADRGSPAPGFRLGFPTIQGPYNNYQANTESYLMLMPSGARVELRKVGDSNVFESVDSSYLELLDGGNGSMLLRGLDGTQMSYWSINSEYRCTEVKDRNGNFITIRYDPINGTANLGRMTSIIDTLGRTLNFNYDVNYRLQTITQAWSGGQTHTWASFGYSDLTVETNFKNESGATMAAIGVPGSQTVSVLTQVGLDDGSRHNFDYTSWGQIYRIKHYAADGHQLNYTTYDLPLTNSTQETDCPRFTQKQDWAENWNNDQPVTTSFEFDAGGQWGQMTSAAGTPDQVSYREYSTKDYSAWFRGLVTSTEIRDAGGTVKKSTAIAWARDVMGLPYALNPRPKRITISDAEGNRRQTSIEYTSFGLPSDVFEQGPLNTSDWTLLRRTHTDYDLSPAYVNRHILGLVQGQYLFAPDAPNSPSVQTLMSKTTYEYDVDTGICTGLCADYATAANNPLITQHDGANYGSGFLVGRGALSRVRRWDAGDEMNESKQITSLIHYNTLGSAIRSSDPLGHQTTIGYADQFSVDGTTVANPSVVTMAYPTTVTDPDSFSSSARYNYGLGMVTRQEDPKGAAKSTEYDSAGRVRQVTNTVNGAYSRLVYPASQTIIVSATTLNDLEHEAFSFTVLDGAGRVRASAADFPDTTPHYSGRYTTYDMSGRSVSQSNPIEIASDWTATGADATSQGGFGWIFTTQTYDWKGRPRITSHPDTTTKEASYGGCGCAGGEVVTLTDEGTVDSGVTRHRQQKIYSDSLGRTLKTEVLNWQGGSVYSASVNTYNARDQLTQVRQYAGAEGSATFQDTTMTFDGFGRLQTKHAPQQNAGTGTTYSYNPDDTLASTTDARGATATYAYNNRRVVNAISYGTPAGSNILETPSVSFAYDEVGNRTLMTETDNQNTVVGRTTWQYDTLSRLTSETRYFKDLAALSTQGNYTVSYSYNLAGELQTISDPFAAQVEYNYDVSGRVTGITGANFANVSVYAENLQYRATGMLKHLDYGNSRTLSMTYNARLQPATFEVPGVMRKGYDYQPDGRLSFSHVLQGSSSDRSFTYDQAGRLTEALSGAEARHEEGSSARPYKQTFTYDALGHLTERPLNLLWSGAGGLFSPAHQDYQNERNVNWQYDAAGNLTNSGNVQYTIDSAQHTRRIISDTYLGWSPFSTISSVTTDLTQSFDGTGAAAKQEEIDTSHDAVEGDSTTATTTYLLRSSVLGGRVLTEINVFGSKQRTFVYLGREVLAWQNQLGSVQSVRWEHRDVHNSSFRLTTENGLLDQPASNELDALGTNVGLHDPTPTAGDYKRMSAYPGFGNALMSSDQQCMVNGILGPCALAAGTLAANAAAAVTVSTALIASVGSVQDLATVRVEDPDTDDPTPDQPNAVTVREHYHYELVSRGWVNTWIHVRQTQDTGFILGPSANFSASEVGILKQSYDRINQDDCKTFVNGILADNKVAKDLNELWKLLNKAVLNKWDSTLTAQGLGITANEMGDIQRGLAGKAIGVTLSDRKRIYLSDKAFLREGNDSPFRRLLGSSLTNIDTAGHLVHELFHVAGIEHARDEGYSFDRAIHENCGLANTNF